jgi:hypothetical protein
VGEEQTLTHLTAIEEEQRREQLASLSNLGFKGSRELRNLQCSINYDARGECSSCRKGRLMSCSVVRNLWGCLHVGPLVVF